MDLNFDQHPGSSAIMILYDGITQLQGMLPTYTIYGYEQRFVHHTTCNMLANHLWTNYIHKVCVSYKVAI